MKYSHRYRMHLPEVGVNGKVRDEWLEVLRRLRAL